MQNQSARVHVPKDWNIVPHEINLGRLFRAPVGSHSGKFADNQRLDVWSGRLLVIRVGPDISDVRISEANDLPRVARVGENFLISGEAGIENDFPAAPGAGARCAAIKNAPVFERKNSLFRV